jgi:hypothetical protein
MRSLDERLVFELWQALGGDPRAVEALRLEGVPSGLPSRFEVGRLASASIALATLAAAELWAARTAMPLREVTVSREHAAIAFVCERFSAPEGWTLPPPWDPIAGDYETADGWVRLHTNYAWHRKAATSALSVAAEKAAVARAVRERTATDVEEAVVARGGAAAALRSPEAWNTHPQGKAVAAEPLVAQRGALHGVVARGSAEAPLAGIRVLDLTRVIAGPLCTRFLAGYGADVLRVDPPAFDEVPALLPEMTRGKRRTFLDLATAEGRLTFDGLVSQAHVLVNGYRLGTLERLGYSAERLLELNPSLVTTRVDAYGHSGPWAGRRGFDSLVQMSTGIAAPVEGKGKPAPLPAQALDHATGYLMAAATCRALAGGPSESLLSLARTARLLVDLGTGGDASAAPHDANTARDFMERIDTESGPLHTVRTPGRIGGFLPRFTVAPGPLGSHSPRFETA